MSNEKQETIADIVIDLLSEPLAENGAKPWLHYLAGRIRTAHKREIAAKDAEIAELRECLREAVREKCPFTRMSCKHGEPCDYECGTFKWRKAIQDEGGAK